MHFRLSLLALPFLLAACGPRTEQPDPASGMSLWSPAFRPGTALPVQFTCDGDNISPPLNWENAPKGTKSFVMILEDPDAPNGVFRHWGAYNIDGTSSALLAGAGMPASGSISQVKNSKDERNYTGPCPPPGGGPHHYRFRIIALAKPQLEMPEDSTVGGLEAEAGTSKLGEATLEATYERK